MVAYEKCNGFVGAKDCWDERRVWTRPRKKAGYLNGKKLTNNNNNKTKKKKKEGKISNTHTQHTHTHNTHTHTHTHARAHAPTHTRTHARTHTSILDLKRLSFLFSTGDGQTYG